MAEKEVVIRKRVVCYQYIFDPYEDTKEAITLVPDIFEKNNYMKLFESCLDAVFEGETLLEEFEEVLKKAGIEIRDE